MPLQNYGEYAPDTPEYSLVKYVDEYGWEWRTVVKIMNRNLHANYTIAELRQMYKLAKADPKTEAPGPKPFSPVS